MTPPAVLITDDDAAFRQTLGDVLAPLGIRALQAADGQEALQIVRRQEIHLVLLDMHMPRLNGLETLEQLKQLKASLPCILLSARLSDAIIDQARRARVFSVLSKPVTRIQITTIVGRALRVTYDWPNPSADEASIQ